MIDAAPIVLEATSEVSDDAGDVEDLPPPDSALTLNSPPIFDAPRTFPEFRRGPCDNPTH